MTKRWMILGALAHCPLLSADDLALWHGLGQRAARARLLRLRRAGLVERLRWPQTRDYLYYLSPAGITAAARFTGTTSEDLSARYGLDERGLRRRLAALDRLCAGRRVLLRLHRALATAGGGLDEWHPWPVPWSYRLGGQRRLVSLDGAGHLRLPGRREAWAFGFLWDGDTGVPATVLAAQLARLDLVHRAHAAGLPPVLLITASAERVPSGYRPWLLWTTTGETTSAGLLGARWRGSGWPGEELTLADALATLGLPTRRLPESPEGTPSAPDVAIWGTGRPVQGATASGHRAQRAEPLPSLASPLPPRALALLELIGQHPLLSVADIALAAGAHPVDTWVTLALLRRHGLVQVSTPPTDRCTRRHVLARRGLSLLARRVGLGCDEYRRLYGVLDDGGRPSRRALAFARANLAHTDGINRLFLALQGAVRAADGSLWWRGEWACTHTYLDGARRCTLRPDAEGRYGGPGGPLRFFVEVDRGTTQAWYLAEKLARYAHYRDCSGLEQVTVLLVTGGPGRAHHALLENEALPARTGRRAIDLRVTTEAEPRERGSSAQFWHDAGQPCNFLLPHRPKPLSPNAPNGR